MKITIQTKTRRQLLKEWRLTNIVLIAASIRHIRKRNKLEKAFFLYTIMIEKIVTGSFLTNTYLISKDGKCVIVDPGLNFSLAAEKIKQSYEVVAILLTHGHIDHIDGIRFFDCPIYIHEDERQFLFDDSLSLYSMMGQKIPFDANKLDLKFVKDQDEVSFIGYTFKVMHTPGHTRGSVCYLYGSKLLSGDTLFKGSAGRTDFPTGNALDLRRSLSKIISFCSDSTDVYPGHDDKTTIKYERKNNIFIK